MLRKETSYHLNDWYARVRDRYVEKENVDLINDGMEFGVREITAPGGQRSTKYP